MAERTEGRFIREHYEDRTTWLEGRDRIPGSNGASEAAIILGLSKFKGIDEFYEEKIGRRPHEDVSNKPAVKYGTLAEEPIRELVELDLNSKYRIEHYPFDILRLKSNPHIYATLDGELTRLPDKEKGVLEIKTGRLSKKSLEEWGANKIPMVYFAQVCQQLLVTGWSYAIVVCRLINMHDDEDSTTLPEVKWIYRYVDAKSKGVQESIQYLFESAKDFHFCCENGIRPSTMLRWKSA